MSRLRIHRPATRRRPDGYTSAEVLAGTFHFSVAEVREMAAHDPALIRSKLVDGQTVYDWADVLLIAAVTTPVRRNGGDDLQ